MLNRWRDYLPARSNPRESREPPIPSRLIRFFRNRVRIMGWLLPGACFWFMACTGESERLNPDHMPTVTTGLGSFQYGTDTGYGHESAAGYAGLQVTPRLVFSNLTDLRPETTYHYRLVGENEQGVSYGNDATFTTAPAR